MARWPLVLCALGALASPLNQIALSPSRAAAPTVQIGANLPAPPVYDPTVRPLVLWHGLGDSWGSPGMLEFMDMLRETHEGMFVYSIRIKEDLEKDQQAGWFGDLNEQIEQVCEQLLNITELQDGFDAIGFSQGGQFLRAYVQTCNSPPVHNLITFGSQHMGVSDIPMCKPGDIWCLLARSAVKRGVYSGYAQHNLVQLMPVADTKAQYFRDPKQYDLYLSANRFLPIVNSELPPHLPPPFPLTVLANLVLIRFTAEQTVNPPVSSHFGSAPAENATAEIPMREQELYREDWIGLRKLDERGGVVMLMCEGQHMQLKKECWEPIVMRWTGGAAAKVTQSRLQAFWNHPAGPKTVFFWAPMMKWCLVAAGLKDLSRPADKLSVPQNVALAATGIIWVRYSFVIIPVNYSLAAVNLFVGGTGMYQLYRVWDYRRALAKQTKPAVLPAAA
ncbi:alpha/beta-hydrolase [Calocera cornea HHB12733]|uniref:Mitochondrial pyruvate carrier n=1 Tax=Calocera cornea HHB12733 TaxID=1353952 RepID=A0A165F4B2_9BASI|nr:alpha/beta-hydrolase [Calocera cornea HHB12733]